MVVGNFLEQLISGGRPVFEDAASPRDLGAPAEKTQSLLLELDGRRRLDAPGQAPGLELGGAHWAAGLLCRLCQFLAFREIPEETIEAEWEVLFRPGGEVTPEKAWSVDLAFSYLPGVFRLGVAADDRDPMLRKIRELARAWPLSGIGVEGVSWEEADFSVVLSDACLRRMLIDRVIEHGCREVIDATGAGEMISRTVGDHGATLAPRLEIRREE